MALSTYLDLLRTYGGLRDAQNRHQAAMTRSSHQAQILHRVQGG